MSDHDTGKASVAFIGHAKTGDVVWIFDSEASRYVDGKYKGRGVWKLRRVESETRQSLIAHGLKFGRKTGEQRDTRGYSATYQAYGETEKQDREFVRAHRANIERLVSHCSVGHLRQIADILGYDPGASHE